MPRPIRKEYVGAKYHITARGNGRNAIFLCKDDYDKFVEQLTLALKKDVVVLYAYAIMPNHYHLLVETPRGNLHEFMRRLNTAYSLYWRYKHKKPGHVFQGRYKAKLVSGDKYLLALTRYIHLNPVKGEQWNKVIAAERYRQLEQYPWSSYQAYIARQKNLSFVHLRWLELMGGATLPVRQERYRAYIKSMILKDDEELRKILSANRYAVGDEEFIAKIQNELRAKRRHGDVREKDVEWPDEDFIGLARIDELVSKTYGIKKEYLKSHGNMAGEAKGMALELACTLGGMNQRAVGRYYGGISCAAVGQQRRRLHDKMTSDVLLQRKYEQLKANLNV